MKANELCEQIGKGMLCETLEKLYGNEALEYQTKRYLDAVESFAELYGGEREISLFSVPGRSEISGNHTDHNQGRVLAAAIDLDIIAVAAKSEKSEINIKSKGFEEDKVPLKAISPDKCQKYSSSAIILGMCEGVRINGGKIGGFDAYTTSDVFKGSGLSSSAAFEVMVGNILNHFYNEGSIEAPEIAKIAQYSENVFFGKPCGLMDQTACAVGGFVAIDFEKPGSPVIDKLNFDLNAAGYSLCIVNTGGNHADLNDDYASIPREMKSVAAHFGKSALRGLRTEEIMENIAELRETSGDRAVLRALHFIAENERVACQTDALKQGKLDVFLEGVRASGESSFKWLQNIYTTKNVSEQGLSLALLIAENTQRKCGGVCRVHGGGFAGTIQAFVPNENVAVFKDTLEGVFGENSCAVLRVRSDGAIKVL